MGDGGLCVGMGGQKRDTGMADYFLAPIDSR